ncbi:hypothetical protein MXB_923 [Myxobolus squamalis]|nr:hypothetical protein MXB_923 [Myxobolus squamalis]
MENYENLVEIGQGTYGVVYRATHKTNGTVVAIKKIRVETLAGGVPTSTIREISVLKEFDHPRIIRLIEVVYEVRRLLCLVFEHMQEDLKSFLSKNTLSQQEALKLFSQILSATAYCHGYRILHRDIKPQNILIDSDRNIKMADFGLARCFGIPLRPYTHEVVTLWYRAPEILLKNEFYSAAVDMWSIGCVYVEMLIARPLFPGDTEIGQLIKIFKILGTPDKSMWAEVENLPYFSPLWPKWTPISLNKLLPNIPAIGLLLLTVFCAF